ncbi:MAG: isochorismatase family protein [Phycisphaerae bacterium]|nr:isochorismatase family protein [Phycisphaerae bacterium]
MPIPRLRRDRVALLVIDVQERLLPTIACGEAVAHNCGILLDVAAELGMPAVVTEQYVQGLGRSAAPILARIRPTTPVIEKTKFSAVVPETIATLDRLGVGSVLVCGVEAHVCVLQTTLDLLAQGRQVFLVTDAIASGAADQVPYAIERMVAAGAALSGALGATYELLGDAADPKFRACLSLVKQLRPLHSVQ